MKVAVVGAGFTGLALSVSLADQGHQVEVFEKEKVVGGLAAGFELEKGKSWPLEIFYHHIFSNDREIIAMAKKVGLPPRFHSPVSSCFINGKELRLDSPFSVLTFSELSILSRLWMSAGMAILKIIPNGLFLEKYRVVDFLPKLIGGEAYQIIWEKLLVAKFGSKYKTVNMAWFWSRVAKRTKNLGYFEGGFQALADKMKEYAEEKGAIFHLGKTEYKEKDYDRIVMTVPAPLAKEKSMPKIDYLWGQTLVLELKNSLINSYWLNILEKDWPFLVVVEHTNMIDKKNYEDKIIVYIGNYLEEGRRQLKMNMNDLIDLYVPFLKRINKKFEKKWIKKAWLWKKPFSQPVFPTNYSKILKKVRRHKGKYIYANMSMVYPFDRGTNYAVKMGVEIARENK